MENITRDDLALRMLAAWMNVRVDQLPPENTSHLNPTTMAAWQRVGEAAIAWHQERDEFVRIPRLQDDGSEI